jgi:oligoendopeptidase F
MTAISEALPAWDLDTLAAVVHRTSVDTQLGLVLARADNLARAFRGRVASLDEDGFERFIGAYQDCVQQLQRITSYAELAVASGVLTSEGMAALTRCDLAWSTLMEALGFVEPELAAMAAGRACEHKIIAPGGGLHNFYRRVLATSGPPDEVAAVLAAVQPTGLDGWQTLARQLLSRIKIVTPDGETGLGGTMPKLYQSDQSVRRQAHREITQALAGELDLRATALSMIVRDGMTRADLTGASWLDEALVSDQLTQTEVDALLAGATAGYPIVHEYYELKARLLCQAQLDETDRYAPLGEDRTHISWTQAVETVVGAFDGVHPRCGAAARELLAANRVDAVNRPGKATSPFTKDVPSELPWISVNFNGSLRHVLLLAHELGHGVHLRMSAELPLLAATTPRVLAETVALFFESVTLSYLERWELPSSAAVPLIARWIEDQAVAICRQAAIFRFEAGLRERMRSDGYLDTDTISELWLNSQRELYGRAVTLSDSFASWWSYQDSLYQSPGSSYAYLYGQFAAAALAEQHAAEGAGFGERLLALMAAGDSAPPRELLQRAGIDPLAPATWQAGLTTLARRVEALRLTGDGPADRSLEGSSEPSRTLAATHPGR